MTCPRSTDRRRTIHGILFKVGQDIRALKANEELIPRLPHALCTKDYRINLSENVNEQRGQRDTSRNQFR